jgi:transcriptional regulator with PAS, ATPase and Fis domain
MTALRAEVESLKNSDAKVLITGESGVGKEVVAHAIHRSSKRAKAKLVSLNCAGITESLLESELFGHVKGSFTGAYRDKPGLLELAHHGTAFLDEIGEMPSRMQGLLLRFLETGEVQRVGSLLRGQLLDVRIICATNRFLPAQIEAGAFRADLYYRLNVVYLKIPPLRDRPDDIVPLAAHFLRTITERERVEPPRLHQEVVQHLLEHSWPGNVRELRNVIERLITRRAGQVVTPDDLRRAWSQDADAPRPVAALVPARVESVADQLFDRMVKGGESFWSAVYPAFVSRDLTRDTVRDLISKGLTQARGNYKILLPLFNMKDTEYRRFLAFLRKHSLYQPFRNFRTPFPTAADRPASVGAASHAGSVRSAS